MDNLAHTLAGAALGEAGLKKKSGLGLATLIIAANLPDIDALGLLAGENLAWRRGWTHGPLALVILPVLLTGAMMAFDRWQSWRGTRPTTRPPVRPGWLLALACIGLLSHPFLDFLNTYGIRCLMPFSNQWFYGDALFIIDLWVWSALGLGIWLARRRHRRQERRPGHPALVSLLLVLGYSAGMGTASLAAQGFVAREVAARGLGSPVRVVASPVPVDPFRRKIVADMGDIYHFGVLSWSPAPRLTLDPDPVPTQMNDPAIARAGREKHVADFLYWSRLPFATIERSPGQARVTIGDARYNRWPDDGPFTVRATVPDQDRSRATLPTGRARDQR
ncbi:MAG: metal-dependent hydrolase [Sphingomonadaceae bacterium]